MFVAAATTALADKLTLPTLGTSLSSPARPRPQPARNCANPTQTALRRRRRRPPVHLAANGFKGAGVVRDEARIAGPRLPRRRIAAAVRGARDAPVPPSSLRGAARGVGGVLADEVAPLLDKPYAFYGFSLGALLLYELCLELDRRGAPSPLALVASGCGAPHAVSSPQRLADAAK